MRRWARLTRRPGAVAGQNGEIAHPAYRAGCRHTGVFGKIHCLSATTAVTNTADWGGSGHGTSRTIFHEVDRKPIPS